MERRTIDDQSLTKAQQYIRAQHSVLEARLPAFDFELPPLDELAPAMRTGEDPTADCCATAFEALVASELDGAAFTQAMDAVDAIACAPQPGTAEGAWAVLRQHAPQLAAELAACLSP